MEEYCAIIITPDSVRLNLEETLIDEILREAKATLLCKKYLNITEGAVRFLYPTKVHKSYFPSMLGNVISGKSVILLVGGERGTTETIKRLKGRFYVEHDGSLEVSGLRKKYGAAITKPDGRDKQGCVGVYEFRLHTSNNFEETATICALFFDEKEMGIIQEFAQSLYFKTKNLMASNPDIFRHCYKLNNCPH